MTDKFITVLTVTYPHELAIIKGLLESEEIECRIQDELTTQVNPLLSNAIGGVKLQVNEKDLEKTVEILLDAGYLKKSDLKPSKSWEQIDKYTSKLPVLNKLRVERRLLVLTVIFIVLLFCFICYLTLPL